VSEGVDEATLQGMARLANKGEPISMEDVGRMVQIVEWLRICGYKIVKREPTKEMAKAGEETDAGGGFCEGNEATIYEPNVVWRAMWDAA
jgi:hypothetical protein